MTRRAALLPLPWTEIVVAGLGAAALVSLLRIRTDVLLPPDPAYALPGDHHVYRYMSEHPVGSFHVAPWGWRILGPALAAAVPGSASVGAAAVALLAIWGTATTSYVTARVAGFDRVASGAGVALFLSLGFAAKYNLYDVWLVDPLAFLFTSLALLFLVLKQDVAFGICLLMGVFAKESVLFAAVLYYGLRAERPFDLRVASKLLILIAPAVIASVGLHVVIDARNGDDAYVASLPEAIRRNARTVPSYDVASLIRGVSATREWLPTVWGVASAFGLVVPALVAVGVRSSSRLAARVAPFAMVVLTQLVFAFQTQRLVVLAFPAVVLLAVAGVDHLRARSELAPALVVLVIGTFALGLIARDDPQPSAVAQLGVVGAAAAVAVAWQVMLDRRSPVAA